MRLWCTIWGVEEFYGWRHAANCTWPGQTLRYHVNCATVQHFSRAINEYVAATLQQAVLGQVQVKLTRV